MIKCSSYIIKCSCYYLIESNILMYEMPLLGQLQINYQQQASLKVRLVREITRDPEYNLFPKQIDRLETNKGSLEFWNLLKTCHKIHLYNPAFIEDTSQLQNKFHYACPFLN